ncbi:hypothetical protein ACFSSA_11015 [Luteolibacter algae]|uniref:Uncharacterized protein n=1 Tax=Luteolibacter algae TaxID=454151 RepID=A0ABW5D8H9_9BACT
MSSQRPPKPFLNIWLKRTRKQLSISGRLSELALVLARTGEKDAEFWRIKLQRILACKEDPTFELLTFIDSFLSSSAAASDSERGECELQLF